MGSFSYSFVILIVMISIAQGGVYTIGVRLRVARFDDMGNAKALLSEASNK